MPKAKQLKRDQKDKQKYSKHTKLRTGLHIPYKKIQDNVGCSQDENTDPSPLATPIVLLLLNSLMLTI